MKLPHRSVVHFSSVPLRSLIVAVEQRQVSWPGPVKRDCGPGEVLTTKDTEYTKESWEILTAEMKRYEYEISATGHLSYNAPAGYHDDCVIALALANQGRWEMGNAGMMLRIAGGGGAGSRRTEARGRRRVLAGG